MENTGSENPSFSFILLSQHNQTCCEERIHPRKEFTDSIITPNNRLQICRSVNKNISHQKQRRIFLSGSQIKMNSRRHFAKTAAKERAERGTGGEGGGPVMKPQEFCVPLRSPRAVFVKGIVGEATGKTTVGFHGNINRSRREIQVFGGNYSARSPLFLAGFFCSDSLRKVQARI